MDYRVHGILQARILEWVAYPLFLLQGDLPNSGMEPRSPALQADSLPAEPPGKAKNTGVGSLPPLQQIVPTRESNQGLLHCRQILWIHRCCFLWACLSFPQFPGSSDSTEPTCNAGDASSISGSGRSAGEGIGCSLQYSWASLIAQLVKNPPEMWETWVGSLGWKYPLEKGKSTQFNILA